MAACYNPRGTKLKIHIVYHLRRHFVLVVSLGLTLRFGRLIWKDGCCFLDHLIKGFATYQADSDIRNIFKVRMSCSASRQPQLRHVGVGDWTLLQHVCQVVIGAKNVIMTSVFRGGRFRCSGKRWELLTHFLWGSDSAPVHKVYV